MIHVGDIRLLDGAWLPPVGVITGGSPCQDLSIAGSRTGLAGSSSCLYLEQMRVVAEMRKATRGQCPRYMVWENVPGALNTHGGRDFLEVLNYAVKACDESAAPLPVPGKWASAGVIMDSQRRYSIAWRIHDARFWGVAQRRRRIALVIDFGGPTAPEVLFDPESVHGSAQAGGAGGENSSDGTPAGAAIWDARGYGDGKCATTITGDHESRISSYTNLALAINADERASGIGVAASAHTIEAVYIGNGQAHSTCSRELAGTVDTMHDAAAVLRGGRVRRLTPLECERLQGYPDNWTLIGPYWTDRRGKKRDGFADTPRYRALGNSIALPFWAVLMRRIHARLPEGARTLGSLFDGIGGFPLVFPGEPVWASEIDDFCVAVTKKHFGTRKDTETTRELFRRFPPPWVSATKAL